MDRRRPRALRTSVAAAALLVASALTGCGDSEPEAPLLTMPDLVGQSVGNAEATTYDALHTSLIYFDLAPADRPAANDWVVVATQPASGKRTRKFETVHAWVLRASEYRWFQAHATVPKIPSGTNVAKLIGQGGLLEPVKDLVQLRYQPGDAPTGAKPSPVDATAFTPDRGMHPDLATEPGSELALRTGLLVAPAKSTVVVAVRPGAGTTLRPGQYLVVLVKAEPPVRKKPGGSDLGPSTGSPGGGSGGTKGRPHGGIKLPGGITIPGCPKALCG